MNEIRTEVELPGGRVLRIVRADLTEQKVDAIVNAANTHLAHGGGVAGAIVRKGGRIIQEESHRLAPVPVGQNAVTTAGALPARHVIHAVGPMWGEGDEDRKLHDAFRNALERAGELNCATIALPAISSGIFGFPKDRCARIFFDVVESFFVEQPGSSLKEILSVNIDGETVEVFAREAARRARGR